MIRIDNILIRRQFALLKKWPVEVEILLPVSLGFLVTFGSGLFCSRDEYYKEFYLNFLDLFSPSDTKPR